MRITIRQIQNRFKFLMDRLRKTEGSKLGQWQLAPRDIRAGGYEILEVTSNGGSVRIIASACSKREFNCVLDGMHALLDLQEMERQDG